MSKRRNDDAPKDDTPSTAKRSRKPPGFRNARPPGVENTARAARTSSSSSRSSTISTLVLGPNGRLGGRRKDRSHLISKYYPSNRSQFPNLIFTLAAPLPGIEAAENPVENFTPCTTDMDLPQADLRSDENLSTASPDVATESGPKLKRKRKNDTRVCDSPLVNTPQTDPYLFPSQNFRNGSCFETPLLTRSYVMTV